MRRAADPPWGAALLLALLGCKATPPVQHGPQQPGVQAIVDPDRGEHFFDVPFPSDDRLDAAGHPDLTGFPTAGPELAVNLIGGWAGRLEQTAVGFGNNTGAYFRFEGPLDLPDTTEGLPSDPVLLIDLETGALTPLLLRFIEDSGGDAWYGDHTLSLLPALGRPPRSGATLAAVVMQSAGALPADGYAVPAAVQDALSAAGVSGDVAVATTYTVQDTVGQLGTLAEDALDRLGPSPAWEGVAFRQVTALEYRQGLTPSGNEGTEQIITYADGGTSSAWLAPQSAEFDHIVDLGDAWPMAVYEAEVPLYNYSGLDDRPYMNPGLGHITDFGRMSGWIDFEGAALASEPDVEPVRVTLCLPKGADGAPIDDAPVVIWDHGTGGSAYNIVHRRNTDDDSEALMDVFAAEGWAVLSRDSPLYGTRYPLIDEGYGASLGFYNIVNLPAFRDNQRQAAIEGEQLRHFVQTGLDDLLPAGSIDATRVRRAGHSLGSVTTNLGVSFSPGDWESVFLSGSGGVFTHYALDTGLLDSFDSTLLDSLFGIVGAPVPDDADVPAILGAVLGIPEESWDHVDRHHPALMLFQWTMDPSDPMSVAPAETVPVDMIIGLGDYQVPDFTSFALVEALPEAGAVTPVEARAPYDPHWVLHREPEGAAALEAWLRAGR